MVSYHQRRFPVRVDLRDARLDGKPGEGDVLVDVESIVGGRGADRLAGDHGTNTIDGGPGRDRLIGRGGDDFVWFGGGSTSCGPGADQVTRPYYYDGGYENLIGARPERELEYLQPDCETVDFGYSSFPPLPAYPTHERSRPMSYRVSCPLRYDSRYEEYFPVACSGDVTLKQVAGPRRLLGRGTFPKGRWAGRRVTIRLAPLGRRLARHRGGVTATSRSPPTALAFR